MRTGRIIIAIVLICVTFFPLHAQWDAQFALYWAARSYYNPAFAGETESVRAIGIYQKKWAGIKNAPDRYLLVADMPLEFFGTTHGIGIVSFTDKTNSATNTSVSLQYAFKKPLGKGFFNIGIQAGINKVGFDAANVNLASNSLQFDKPSLTITTADKQVFDLNAGISWTSQRAFLGISATHITRPHIETVAVDSSFYINPAYYFISGYNIPLPNPLYEIQPSVMARLYKGDLHSDATIRLVYDKKYSAGASWRPDDGFAFFIGATVKGFDAGYAYEISDTPIAKASKGSHEVFLRYNFSIDLFRKETVAHKSVRIL